MKFSVVIPTYNRPDDLRECLDSIAKQSLLPQEVIIVDDGNLGREYLQQIAVLLKKHAIAPRYFTKDMPGTAASRNIGARKAQYNVVFILDDDLILRSRFFEAIMNDWQGHINDQTLAGIGGFIENLRRVGFFESLFNKIFYLSSPINWDMTDVGFQVSNQNIREPEIGYYMHGGVASYRKDILHRFPFQQHGVGKCSEDSDFSLRIKKAGLRYLIEPKALAYHKQSPVSRESVFSSGFREGYQRVRLFHESCEQSWRKKVKFAWSSLGWILRQIFAGHLAKAVGMFLGNLAYVFRR